MWSTSTHTRLVPCADSKVLRPSRRRGPDELAAEAEALAGTMVLDCGRMGERVCLPKVPRVQAGGNGGMS